MGKPTICLRKQRRRSKTQISFAVTAKLISAFVFANRIVQFLLYFKLLALFCDCTGRFVSYLVGNHFVGFPTRRLNYVKTKCGNRLCFRHCDVQFIFFAHQQLSRLVGKPTMWFHRSDTNQPVQAQKRARSLKIRIYVEDELYYPSSENKGADQLIRKLICAFVFANADCWFSHGAAQFQTSNHLLDAHIAAHSAYDMFSWNIVSFGFSHLGFWSGNLFLIAPFPDLCLLVPFCVCTARNVSDPVRNHIVDFFNDHTAYVDINQSSTPKLSQRSR